MASVVTIARFHLVYFVNLDHFNEKFNTQRILWQTSYPKVSYGECLFEIHLLVYRSKVFVKPSRRILHQHCTVMHRYSKYLFGFVCSTNLLIFTMYLRADGIVTVLRKSTANETSSRKVLKLNKNNFSFLYDFI